MSEKAILYGSMTNRHTLLTSEILYQAYSQGFFPMPEEDSQEILWYRPDPRAIIPLDGFKVSRSLKKKIRRNIFEVTYNQNFSQVIESCSNRPVTWINEEIKEAYKELYLMGLAHSVEIWLTTGEDSKRLVGGVYGVGFGAAFFAESMFHKADDASKIALYYLIEQLNQKGFDLLECQFLTSHLKSLGAVEIEDTFYMKMLRNALKKRRNFL
jgi:leucyl/phenylalanyl-tRNA--protein transferase